MALAFLLSRLRATHPLLCIGDHPIGQLTGITIDHGLRDGSAAEAAAVAEALRRLDITPLTRRIGRCASTADGKLLSLASKIEKLARRGRYRSLGRASPRRLFVAHHRDDDYETVLMRLVTGRSFWGLRGIRPAVEIPECYGCWGVTCSSVPLPSPASSPSAPSPLATESFGVRVYRPLLSFDKDRLRATCEAHGVPWWDDPTNSDMSLTLRNAVRGLVSGPQAQACLPVALRKPAVLDLARRVDASAAALEAEAVRRFFRLPRIIRSFCPNTGVLVADLPRLVPSPCPLRACRSSSRRLRRHLRCARLRLVASLIVRKLMHFVSPEPEPPTLQDLDLVVSWLFPSLAESTPSSARSGFVHSSVFFQPDPAAGRWRLSRALYPRTTPRPAVTVSFWPCRAGSGQSVAALHDWVRAQPSWIRRGPSHSLFDGRFWVRLNAKVAGDFRIAPYATEHAAAFRAALPRSDRARLAAALHSFAPEQTRFTLPAIYADAAVAPPSLAGPNILNYPALLALPTLDVFLPGFHEWLRCHFTYKSVDRSLLGQELFEQPLPMTAW